MSPDRDVLRVEGLVTGYAVKQVLDGVDLAVRRRQTVALIGHNGAGKSTLLKAIFGLLPAWSGRILLDGVDVDGITSRGRMAQGVVYIPQGNRVFGDLTVRENLAIAGVTLRDRGSRTKAAEQVLERFPALGERLDQRAHTLSGGEKQMLALANGLVLSPRLLLVDEPSLGLSPKLVTLTLETIQALARQEGISVLIVEQKVRQALSVADWVVVLRNGSVSFSGPPSNLSNDERLRAVYL